MSNNEVTYIVDRVESDIIILETEVGKFITLPTILFPFPLKEGDILRLIKDEVGTEEAKELVAKKLNMLFKKGK